MRIALGLKERKLEKLLADHFSESGAQVKTYGRFRKPWQKLVHDCGDIIVLSESYIPLPVESGLALLNNLPEKPTTVILSNEDSPEENARLFAAGADVVLFAGIAASSMVEAFASILESRRQFNGAGRYDMNGRVKPEMRDFSSRNQAMKFFMEEVQQVVATDSALLILGETGVGKEHLAKVIHAESHRSSGPFIAVNTAAVPDQLLESEMFGHERGAFTGAIRARRGAFELAHQGTIFLDEIGDMPLHMQVKLLRVLQEQEVTPVGAEKPLWVDVRIIAATNKDLEKEVALGNFRQDLYYRLNVITLLIPPLRSRREDIPAMAEMFAISLRSKIGRGPTCISREALDALCRYDWPGNVRELMNVLERAMLLSKGVEITPADLPAIFRDSADVVKGANTFLLAEPATWEKKTLPEVLLMVEKQVEGLYLEQILRKTRGRMAEAAKLAGIHPRSLYNKMRCYGLRKETFK
ncbi:MAG: sigma-54-dependent Fis family transcriptional regulator [Deltaproteobacteria bacterium]|nr:sigma-54-dependent Fis family transcriptional regulator [Deltaproteobacteria bacterium]